MNAEHKLRQRAWYYSKIYADPKDADTVYVLNTGLYRSSDGGKTFTPMRVPHGDNHDLWIDPRRSAADDQRERRRRERHHQRRPDLVIDR